MKTLDPDSFSLAVGTSAKPKRTRAPRASLLPFPPGYTAGDLHAMDPARCFCICGECNPKRLSRCWRMRARASSLVKLVSPCGQCAGFIVQLHAPTIWQARAWLAPEKVDKVPGPMTLAKQTGHVEAADLGVKLA